MSQIQLRLIWTRAGEDQDFAGEVIGIIGGVETHLYPPELEKDILAVLKKHQRILRRKAKSLQDVVCPFCETPADPRYVYGAMRYSSAFHYACPSPMCGLHFTAKEGRLAYALMKRREGVPT